ncbi:MAG: fructan hydrolase [Bacteroidales bacterium]
MAWLAVDKDGSEAIFSDYPERVALELNEWLEQEYDYNTLLAKNKLYMWSGASDVIELPKGSIFKLIGKELTWNDETVEIK